MAFSVENILDPNKFTGNKLRLWNSFDREDTGDKNDDDQSESGEISFFSVTNLGIYTKKVRLFQLKIVYTQILVLR